ncbi:hypothetical protein [Verrucomicrobium sp. BvORR106]|uniref:hypothetical protein n=1 Tax=Verrucomicrobium sp. BvORR106 TaxID=1403819 RepID=UPI00056F7387|nr:hypothetical protein [Verrucomicrobium sp. BvORR106]
MKSKATSHLPHRAEPSPPFEDDLSDPVESLVEDLSQQDFMPSGDETILEEYPEVSQNALLMSHSWDEAGVENGDRIARIPLEDEIKCTELLVKDGLDEADEELRDLEEEDEEIERELE